MDHDVLYRLLHRPKNVNKYDFGHVLILGGSAGMTGAPLLAGEAALRSGAGLVTIASDRHTTDILARRVEEIMTFAVSDMTLAAATESITSFINDRHVSVVIIGPGLSQHSMPLVRALVANITLPVILDATGLLAFRNHLDIFKKITRKNPHIVITPHTGEFARLIEADDNLEARAVTFAKEHKITVILKGHHSLIVHPNGAAVYNTTGNPGLATAGTGDVLTGIIAGLLAQHISVNEAVTAAVFLHGAAGDIAARQKTEPGMIASDVIEALPQTLKNLADNR